MTDAHCHVSGGDPSVREFLIGRDFIGVHPWDVRDQGSGIRDQGLNCKDHLPPALGSMEDDGAVKLRGKAQLKLKGFPHALGNYSVLEPIKSDFTDPKPRIRLKRRP